MRHKFLVLTVKELLKSVYIYGSYRKIKTGLSLFFGPPGRPTQLRFITVARRGPLCTKILILGYLWARDIYLWAGDSKSGPEKTISGPDIINIFVHSGPYGPPYL